MGYGDTRTHKMKAHIVITLDNGTVLEGDVSAKSHSSEVPVSKSPVDSKGGFLKKGHLASCIKVLQSQGFFEEKPIVTTPELLKALHLKCNKRIQLKNATRDLGKLITQGVIDRDELPKSWSSPKGTQIWFLPGVDKKLLETFKKEKSTND